MKQLNERISNAESTFNILLRNCDYSTTLYQAAGLREEAARQLLENPFAREHASIWVACSLVVRQLRRDAVTRGVTIQELLEACKDLVEFYNERSAIRSGMFVAVSGRGLYPTENEPVALPAKSVNEFLVETMAGGSKQTAEFLETFPGEIESVAYQGEMVGARSLVLSETLSRAFRLTIHQRLLPRLKDSLAATDFHSIAMNTASFVAVMLGRDFEKASGLLIVDQSQFEYLKASMAKTFGNEAAESFFSIDPHSDSELECLGTAILPQDERRGLCFIPYHSLVMLATMAYRFSKFPEVGKAGNLKGNTMENVIYGAMTGILKTTHPESGAKLLAYQLPEDYGDIDIGGYSDTTLVLIESKFWDAPDLASLEEELAKFDRRVGYLRDNPLWKGAEKLLLLPIFYTPFAPYPKFKDITLVSSTLALVWLVGSKFGFRRFPLIHVESRLAILLQNDKGERLFPFDVSEVFHDIPPDTYRISDGVIDDVDDSEANVNVMLPSGTLAPVPFDISQETKAKLGTEQVKGGTVIRMLLYNLTTGWALTQLVDFKVLKRPDEVKGLDFETALRLASPNASIEDFVMRTWGGGEGKLLLNFAARWQIDLNMLFSRLHDKGHNMFTGIAAAEVLETPGKAVLQCECGDVFSLELNLIEQLQRKTPNGRLRCHNCDPEIIHRLEEITGSTLIPLNLSDVLSLASGAGRKFPP